MLRCLCSLLKGNVMSFRRSSNAKRVRAAHLFRAMGQVSLPYFQGQVVVLAVAIYCTAPPMRASVFVDFQDRNGGGGYRGVRGGRERQVLRQRELSRGEQRLGTGGKDGTAKHNRGRKSGIDTSPLLASLREFVTSVCVHRRLVRKFQDNCS